MSDARRLILDANEATARVAYRTNEVISIYPITPASGMGEHADAWAARGIQNIWGIVPQVVEMQSEGGAAGAVHGALQAGALTTTFTASQGLLLMLPNMYKIAGELTPAVIHVAARSIATHALSIFGDHSDVYAARQTGFAMLASGSGQEAQDFALIAQAASLESRIPFLHFFDGFRTSHELSIVEPLNDDDMRALMSDAHVAAHRARAITPDHPVVRGTAQNPDAFFQAREAANTYYDACPAIVQRAMDAFGDRTGRRYRLFDYVGHPEAERVIVIMGSGAEAAHATAEWMADRGERVGVLKVRLYRPLSTEALLAALPDTTRSIAVLDRTKEPGAPGEPMYLDVLAAVHGQAASATPRFARPPMVVGGRYGLSSKQFDPACIKAVYDHIDASSSAGSVGTAPRHGFTVGINDDVTHLSLEVDQSFDIEADDVVRAVFFGLGSDGTVGANKNSVKIIGEATEHYAQGYFAYDSKKSGAVTVSHLRFGPRPIRAPWLIQRAGFVACHQWHMLERHDVLEHAERGGVFLLNAPYGPDEVWGQLPREVQQQIIDRALRLYVIDADTVARDVGMGRRINTIMQTCFFALAEVLPRAEAIERIKERIEATYESKGEEVVRLNLEAVDATLAALHAVEDQKEVIGDLVRPPVVAAEAPDFVHRVTSVLLAGKGDHLPVSAFPPDGTWPVATAQWEKRNIAHEIPVWDSKICIQCNKCALICPHAAIRTKVFDNSALEGSPETFKSTDYRGKDYAGQAYSVQVAPEDCTGCSLCVEFCPVKDKTNPRHKAIDMSLQRPLRDAEVDNYAFFLDLPDPPRDAVTDNVKGSQFLRPLFEYSGACSGCGETPYVKLLTQLFGDRTLIANATGCSSIYGGNLPTTPYTVDDNGRGPAWSNSLFEDNAEFGLGFRLAVDKANDQARHLVGQLSAQLDETLVRGLLGAKQLDENSITKQRERVLALRGRLAELEGAEARRLETLADYLVRKSVWIVGGDGWAYDIGYGGLDHVLASDADVNILVLDTEVYSNTGGQASKATPMGAIAKFAADGKGLAKKDLGNLAMMHDHVYVARVAIGAQGKDAQTYKAFVEAESWPGPSIIIAYSPCIAHGYDLKHSATQQTLAVETGYWPLFRFDPRRREEGLTPLVVDSKPPKKALREFAYNESRFRMLTASNPERAARLLADAQDDVRRRFDLLVGLAEAETPHETRD